MTGLRRRETGTQISIPKTEALLESYDRMTNRERNTLLKAILRRIEYEKGPDGKIASRPLSPAFPKM